MSFNCGRTHHTTSQGYLFCLLCMTPLNSEKTESPSCNAKTQVQLGICPKKKTKKEGLKESVLLTLFAEQERAEIDEESPKGVVGELGMENLLLTILDRNRGQVIEDHRSDVTAR